MSDRMAELRWRGNPQYLTEAQAWRLVARLLARGETLRLGLCHFAWHLVDTRRITPQTWSNMLHRAIEHVNTMRRPHYAKGGRYAFPPGRKVAERIDCALLLAAEAAEDARRFARQDRRVTL